MLYFEKHIGTIAAINQKISLSTQISNLDNHWLVSHMLHCQFLNVNSQ